MRIDAPFSVNCKMWITCYYNKRINKYINFLDYIYLYFFVNKTCIQYIILDLSSTDTFIADVDSHTVGIRVYSILLYRVGTYDRNILYMYIFFFLRKNHPACHPRVTRLLTWLFWEMYIYVVFLRTIDVSYVFSCPQ